MTPKKMHEYCLVLWVEFSGQLSRKVILIQAKNDAEARKLRKKHEEILKKCYTKIKRRKFFKCIAL